VAQTVPASSVEFEIEVLELDGTVGEAEATTAAHLRCSRRFDWESEIAWRPFIVTDGARPRYLVLVLDHMLADGFGLLTLRGELQELLCGIDKDGRHWLVEIPRQPRELAQAQASDEWKSRRAATDRYWDNILSTVSPDVFPWRPGPADAGRIEGVLRSPKARVALARAADRMQVSPQSVMLALTSVAVASACQQEDVVLTLQASNRYHRRWRYVVTSMNQAAPLPVAVGRARDEFDSFARQIHIDGLNAYRHGSYHFDEIVEKVRDATGRDLEFDLYFNFQAHDVLPRDDEDSAHLPERRIDLQTPRRQAGQRLDVKIRQGADMAVEIRADPTLLPAERLAHLLAWFADELSRLASGEQVRVQECRSRAG
jgi:hypothetical protein